MSLVNSMRVRPKFHELLQVLCKTRHQLLMERIIFQGQVSMLILCNQTVMQVLIAKQPMVKPSP